MTETIIYKRPVCRGDEGCVAESVKHRGCEVHVKRVQTDGQFFGQAIQTERYFDSMDFRISERLPKPPKGYRYLCSAKEAEARRIDEWKEAGEPVSDYDLVFENGKWQEVFLSVLYSDSLICTRRPFVAPSRKHVEALLSNIGPSPIGWVDAPLWHTKKCEEAIRSYLDRHGLTSPPKLEEPLHLGLWPHCIGVWEATGKMVVKYGTYPGWEFMRNANSLVREGDEIKCGDRWVRALQVGQPMIAGREYRRKVLA